MAKKKKKTEDKKKKVLNVVLWVGVPYAILKVIEVLTGMEGFAEWSPLLNVVAYVAKQMLKE